MDGITAAACDLTEVGTYYYQDASDSTYNEYLVLRLPEELEASKEATFTVAYKANDGSLPVAPYYQQVYTVEVRAPWTIQALWELWLAMVNTSMTALSAWFASEAAKTDERNPSSIGIFVSYAPYVALYGYAFFWFGEQCVVCYLATEESNVPAGDLLFWMRKTTEQQEQMCTEIVLGETDSSGVVQPSDLYFRYTGIIDTIFYWANLFSPIVDLKALGMQSVVHTTSIGLYETCLAIQSLDVSFDEMCTIRSIYDYFLNNGWSMSKFLKLK